MINIAELLEKYKIPIGLGLLGIVLMIGGLVLSSGARPGQSSQDFPKESIVSAGKVTVDVSGAVATPGVYQLGTDARVEDAIRAAGGLNDKANAEYISKSLNMAQKLTDGVKLYIPFEGDPTVPVISGSAGAVSGIRTSGIISINSASQAELEALPGIGPVTASKIISGRPYGKIEDLLNQKIVGKAVFEKIKDNISI